MEASTRVIKDWSTRFRHDWSTEPSEEGIIDVPDELDPLVDKIALQIGFLLHAGKPDGQVIADIARLSQKFFQDNLGLLFNTLEDGSMCQLLVMHPDQEAVAKACCHNLGDAVQEFYYERQEAIKKQNDKQHEGFET